MSGLGPIRPLYILSPKANSSEHLCTDQLSPCPLLFLRERVSEREVQNLVSAIRAAQSWRGESATVSLKHCAGVPKPLGGDPEKLDHLRGLQRRLGHVPASHAIRAACFRWRVDADHLVVFGFLILSRSLDRGVRFGVHIDDVHVLRRMSFAIECSVRLVDKPRRGEVVVAVGAVLTSACRRSWRCSRRTIQTGCAKLRTGPPVVHSVSWWTRTPQAQHPLGRIEDKQVDCTAGGHLVADDQAGMARVL